MALGKYEGFRSNFQPWAIWYELQGNRSSHPLRSMTVHYVVYCSNTAGLTATDKQ